MWPYATASPTAIHRRSRVQVGSDSGIHAQVEENDTRIFCHNEVSNYLSYRFSPKDLCTVTLASP